MIDKIKKILILLILASTSSYAIPIQNIATKVTTTKTKVTQRTGNNRYRGYNGKRVRNYRYAGKVVSIGKIAPKLKWKYKKPIRYNRNGYPDFSSYSKETVKTIKLTGNHGKDVRTVEKILKRRNPKWKKRPRYTWHHHQDGKTMQYVPTDLHSAIPHSGGASRLRVRNQ